MKTGSLALGLTCIAALHAPAQEADKTEVYRAMLLKRPENPVLFSRFVDAWLAKGEMAGLGELLETEAADGGPMDWRLLAVFRNFTGDEAGAIAALDEALKATPDDARTRLARAKALGAALRFDDALADLDVAETDAAVAVEAGTLRGKFLARAGKPEAAVKAWVKVIAAHPADEGLREDLIELEIGEGMLDEAVAAARELAEQTADPYKKALRHMRVAEILSQAGKKDDAVAAYTEVFGVSAEGSWLEREVLAKVNALFSREDDSAGLRGFYETLRETYPRRVVVKKEAALSLMASGEADEAVAMFREVLKVLPGDREARDEFIAMLEGAGRLKEAADEVNALLATHDKEAALWEKLATIRKLMDDQDGLRQAVEKTVALMPGDEAGCIAAAAVHERYGFPDEAEKTLRAAAETYGINGEAGEALAVMLVSRGKPDEAVAMWSEMAKTADREGLLRISRSLTAHGHAADAYKLLASRMADFEGDSLLLAALCQAAQFSDQSEDAVPQALELVRAAKTTGDLETALRQAIAIVSRAKEPRKYLDELAAKPEPSTQELCLLAEMHETLGDSIQADRVLTKAIESGDPLMAAAQRVRLFELRGDLQSAIKATRDWLAMPGGLRTEQIKRLVILHERFGDYDAALKETENWKRIAPGDKLAWMKRAELFLGEGQPDETVAELRRALAKFGSDEELRAKLAAALSEAGLFDESWRMSHALYEEAETPTAKLKWIGPLAEMAAREGREDELLADFKRRSRDNPTSVVPLLAMAEMFRVWLLPEDEARVVEEASRRKPDDLSLLHRLADLKEQTGATAEAEALLNRAIRIEDSPENRRRLASFWVRNGDPERGLSELLAKGGASPRETERLALSLATAKDWETAARILSAETTRNPDDWRLAYLYANVLRESGSDDEAFGRFAALLDAKGDLPGVLPLIPPEQLKYLGANGAGFRLFAHFRMMTDRSQHQRMWYGNNQSPVPMPGDLTELRWMALAQALSLIDDNEETRAARLAAIHSTELPDLDLIKSIHGLDNDELTARMKEDDADPRLFRWYLETWGNVYRPYQNGTPDPELLRIGLDRCIEADPETALMLMARIPMAGDDGLGRERAARMLELITALDPEKRVNHLGSLLGLSTAKDGEVAAEVRAKAEALLLADLRILGEKQGIGYFHYSVAAQWLGSGRPDEAVAMLNDIYQKSLLPAKRLPAGQMNPYGGMPYFWQGHGRFSELKFPEVLVQIVNHALRMRISPDEVMGMARLTDRQKKLLELLGEKPGGPHHQANVPDPVEPEVLTTILPKLTDPILRIYIAHALGKPEMLGAEIETVGKSEDSTASALRICAAYHLVEKKDPAAAYRLLTRARQQARELERDALDQDIYQVGLALAASPPEDLDLDDARRAALRLRKPMGVNEETKVQLADGMKKLGLEEESRRYTASARVISGNRSRYGMSMQRSRPGGDINAVVSLVAEGRQEAAARRLLASLRVMRANPNSSRSYEENQLYERIASLKLADQVAELAEPPAGAGYNSRREYAMLLTRLNKQDLALPLLRQLSAEKPGDFEARTALLLVLPPEEQRDFVFELTEGDFDSERMGNWFSGLLERNGNGKVADFLANIELFATFLEKLPVSFEVERNISWVPYLAKDVFDNDNFGDVRLIPLREGADKPDKVDEERTRQRDELARRLFHAMLRHPQTSEQGFILMHSTRKPLGISAETMDQAALDAFSLSLRLKIDPNDQYRYGGSRSYQLWQWRSPGGGGRSSGSPSDGLDPLSHLMAGGTDPFTPDFLARLEKDEPGQAKSIRKCLAIVEAPGLDAFNSWKKDAGNAREASDSQLLMIARLAYFKKRADLVDAATDFVCEAVIEAGRGRPMGVGSEWNEVIPLAIRAAGDLPGRMKVVRRVTLALLGPEEAWELYGDTSTNQQVHAIQVRASAYQQVGQALHGSPEAAVAFARFAAEHRIGGLANMELQGVMASNKVRSDPEGSVKNWIAFGLFAPGPAPAGSCDSQEISLIEMIERNVNNYSSSDSKKKLADVLLKVDGPESFWARFLGARLAGKPDAAIEVLNSNSADIAKWPLRARNDLARVMTRWFPDAGKNASAPLKRLLADARKRGDAETRKITESYLKDGVPADLQPYSLNGTLGGTMRRQIADDPELAARLWLKVQEHFAMRQSGWNSTSNGYRRTISQYANQQLMQSINEGGVSIVEFAAFVTELGKQDPAGVSGMFDSNSSYYLRRLFDVTRSQGRVEFVKDKSLSKLKEDARVCAGMLASLASEAEKEALPLLAGLFLDDASRGSWSMNDDSLPELRKWIREDLAEIDAEFAEYALLISVPRDNKKLDEADKEPLRKAFLKFAINDRIPADVRITAVIRASTRQASAYWTADADCVSAAARLYALAAAGAPSWSSSEFSRAIVTLAKLEALTAADAQEILTAIRNNPPDASGGMSPDSLGRMHRVMITLALRTGDGNEITRLVKGGADSLRGNPAFMIQLWQAGQKEAAVSLIARPGEYHQGSRMRLFSNGSSEDALPKFDKEIEGKLTDWLASMDDPGQRYRIECLIASAPDADGDDAPQVKRAERIAALAGRFNDECPKARVSREEILAALGAIPSSTKSIAEAYAEAAGKQTLGGLLPLREGNSDTQRIQDASYVTERLIRVAMRYSAELHGDGSFIRKQLESIRPLPGTNQEYHAREMLSELSAWYSRFLVLTLADLPASERARPAAEALAISRFLLDSGRNDQHATAVGLAIASQALAGDGAKLGRWLEGLPEPLRERYVKTRKDRGLRGVLGTLKNDPMSRPEYDKNRRALFVALVTDPATVARELHLQSDFNALVESGIVSREVFLEVVNSVPAESPKHVALLVEKAGVTGWALGRADEALKAYEAAQAAAADDPALANYVKAHRVLYLDRRINRHEDARELAKTIDPEKTPDFERGFVEEVLKKDPAKKSEPD
jgi:tetratricopeptide (TPR) repeat protein